MDKCKVCKQHFKKINKSHVMSKHNLTMEEYEDYGTINLVVGGEPVKNIWDSVNIDSIEFKVRYKNMKYNLVTIRDRYCVDLRQGKNCFGCLKKIDELGVYVILQGSVETRTKKPEFMKKPYHLDCAIASSDRYSLLGLVMNPVETI